MNKTIKNQKGFTVVEALLTILVVVVVGFAGWYVYHTDHKKTTASDKSITTTQSTPNVSKTSATTTNPYAGWKTYSRDSISFMYPSDWDTTTIQQNLHDSTAVSSVPYSLSTTSNSTQYAYNDVLILSTFSSSMSSGSQPIPSNGTILQSNFAINGSDYCLIGYSNPNASTSDTVQVQIVSCSPSGDTYEDIVTSNGETSFILNVYSVNGGTSSSDPVSLTSSDYSTIKLILASLKF